MTWWQSLLIALVPAIITAFISWLISHLQINNTKRELKEKYENENKLYIRKVQFESEFNIYKELCEKTVTMVSDVVSNLFPLGIYYEPEEINARQQYRVKLYNMCEHSFTEANQTINKYACFIPKDIYDKFISLKQQCATQIRSYFAFRITTPHNEFDTNKCYERSEKIEKDSESLIADLRDYISNITKNEF